MISPPLDVESDQIEARAKVCAEQEVLDLKGQSMMCHWEL